MQKSLQSAEYARFIKMLVAARRNAEMRQHALARKLGKPQSFIAKYEGGERRLDVWNLSRSRTQWTPTPSNYSSSLSRKGRALKRG
jgi:hypothetical protein